MSSLEFAINMELEGQQYYLAQAEKNQDNELFRVFQMLAKTEAEHAELLSKRKDHVPYELKKTEAGLNSKSIFDKLDDFKKQDSKVAKQIDAYRLVLDMEKKSIDLYTDMLSGATNEQDKALFEYLMQQEEEHFTLFDELVTLVGRPDDWVESAEFGIREDY